MISQTVMEQLDCLPKNQASLNYVLHNQCRTFNLECICRSLNNDEGGIQSCISDTREVKVGAALHLHYQTIIAIQIFLW